LFLTRDVNDRVERRYRIKAGRWKVELRYIGLNELGLGNTLLRERNLPCGNIHARYLKVLGKLLRRRYSCAATKIEHRGTGGQFIEQHRRVPGPFLCSTVLSPFNVSFGDAVVTLLDNLLWVQRVHGLQTLIHGANLWKKVGAQAIWVNWASAFGQNVTAFRSFRLGFEKTRQ